ncbi:hypothetical protein AMTRI_Chr04g249060 [Amborella trichopoda]
MKADSSAQCLLFKNIIAVEITYFIYGMLTGVNSYWALSFDDCVIVSFIKLCSTWTSVGRGHFHLQDCTIFEPTTSNFKSLIKLLENQQYLIAYGNSEKHLMIAMLALSLVIHVE